jgi:hypothetical protein
MKGLVKGEDSSPDRDGLENVANNIQAIYLGDCKDPKHLPPKNFTQVLGNHIRKTPQFMGSSHAKFGLRVTVATMSISIMAFLKNSHAFFYCAASSVGLSHDSNRHESNVWQCDLQSSW